MALRTTKQTARQDRSALDTARPKRLTPCIIVSVAATAADTVQLTFDTRVSRNRTPMYTAGAGAAETVTGAMQISDTVVELVFSGVVQGTNMIVPEGDPGIRTAAGGFVPAGTYAVPAFP